MPAERTAKASTSKAASQSNKYKKPAKKVKPELSVEEKVQKRWRSIKDQIAAGFTENALKSCLKILELDPSNSLAQQVHIQLLLTLDRYSVALSYIISDEERKQRWGMEHSYTLYKLGREQEASQVLEEVKASSANADDGISRTIDVLDAQIKYRLEQFSDSQLLYEDLLATVETDSPERDDLTTNLSACNAHIEFIASIPSRLAELSSSSTSANRLPPIDVLETTPIAPLVAADPAYKARPTAHAAASSAIAATSSTADPSAKSASATSSESKKSGARAGKKTKLPASIANLPEDKRPKPDPERWLPKRERKGYADVLAAKEREKEKRRLKNRKKLEASMTQGSAGPAAALAAAAVSDKPKQQQQAGGGQQNKKKKKKGGK